MLSLSLDPAIVLTVLDKAEWHHGSNTKKKQGVQHTAANVARPLLYYA